ncbi:MAG TPA: two-component regulator propeller domain-containing protein [Paludibacter sp.]|nr:two-component regulator propeller domain-containing protein [Paludibacter sp.]
MKKLILNALIVVLPCLAATASTIKKLTVEQGLSNDNVNSIVQDRKGFMWFGTRSGLNRFDGNRMNVFTHSPLESNTINSNELNPVFADKHDNIIWIATERNGVNAYDYDTNKFTYYTSNNTNNSISSNGVTGISDDPAGNIWFATYNAGIDHLDKKNGQFTHFNQSNVKGLKSNYNWCATDDRKGHLYVGHVNNGMSIINIKERTAVNFSANGKDPNSIPNNFVNCIFIDSKDRVWVGTNSGLALFNPRLGKFIAFRKNPANPNSLSGNRILCITEINNNSIWIGTSTGGVSILNYEDEMFNTPEKVSFQHVPVLDSPNGLSNAYIYSIKQDSYGNIWVGTSGGGVNFIQNKPDFFNKISCNPDKNSPSSLSNKLVSGLCLDNAGNLWVGTEEKGIDVFNNNIRIKNFNRQNSIVSDNISCSFTDSEKNLWFGNVDGGIVVFNAKSKQFAQLPGFKPADGRIRSFYEDSRRNIWICSDNGLFSYNMATREIKPHFAEDRTGLTDNVVRSVVEDSDGNLWVGTLGGGLCVFNPSFRRIHHYPPGDVVYGVNHIYKDSKNRIWIGTRYNLLLFRSCRDTTYQKLGLKEGFADCYFHAITEGATPNDIWVSTTNGISHLNVAKMKVRNFNKLDGIPLGDYMNAAVTTSADGTVYFGSQNGVCWFNALTPFPDQKLPSIVISSFSVADKNVDYSGGFSDIPVKEEIELNHNQNTFTVSFSIPDFSLNKKAEFSYQLKGLDENWFNILDNKELTFRNLRPGTYTLNLKCRLRNNEWPKEYQSTTIVIHPPFWFSWWAKLVYVIIAIVMAYYLTRFYKRKLDLENSLYLEKKDHLQEQEMNDERLRFFTNIAHELRTPLTLIIGPLEDLAGDPTMEPQQKKKVNSIHRSAKRLLDLINQILEFRKSETRNRRLSVHKGDIAGLVREIGLKYKELNQNPKINFHIVLPHAPVGMYFDTEVITIILDNLISNAIKYTLKGSITLELKPRTETDKPCVEIRVSDTGVGIPAEALPRIFDRYYQVKGEHQMSGTGIGLSLVKNMVDLHQGEITVDSTINKGTTFTVQLQLNNTYPDAIQVQQKEVEIDEAELEIHTESRQLMLVVEDNPEINEYIRDSFTSSFDVFVAENGKKGLQIALDKIPDIIITDIMMPVMDGIELCKKLKEDVRTCHIPIIMLTAKGSLQDKTEGYNVGADSYLTKPFSGNLLRSRVSNLLETRKKISQMFSSTPVSKHAIVMDSISKLDNEFLEKLTGIIEENLEIEQLNIAQISEQMNMSHSSLYRKIKMLTGLSVNEYIRKIRMRNAEKLLLSCKYTIAEIIYKVGISTPAYFRQCFKEEFGMAPKDYMKKVKEEN